MTSNRGYNGRGRSIRVMPQAVRIDVKNSDETAPSLNPKLQTVEVKQDVANEIPVINEGEPFNPKLRVMFDYNSAKFKWSVLDDGKVCFELDTSVASNPFAVELL